MSEQVEFMNLRDRPAVLQVAELAIVTIVIGVPRLVMIEYGGAHTGGDSDVYMTVAANILDHGCVSMADPKTGECTPHWGGNQLPGFPAFTAVVWAAFGKTVTPVLLAQSAAFVAAAIYLTNALRRWGLSVGAVWGVVCLLAVSPSLIGWSRSMLTETLSLALSLLLLAEVVRSFEAGRLRILSIGAVFACGLFVRYDFALLAAPITITCFMIHSPLEAFRRGLIVALVVAAPLVAWTARSVAHGLPSTPPFGLTPEGDPLPSGMMAWTRTWLDNQYDLPASVWALVHFNYQGFQPPDHAYADSVEQERVNGLMEDLRIQYDRIAPPNDIDEAFGAIAIAKRQNAPFEQYILLPIENGGDKLVHGSGGISQPRAE